MTSADIPFRHDHSDTFLTGSRPKGVGNLDKSLL